MKSISYVKYFVADVRVNFIDHDKNIKGIVRGNLNQWVISICSFYRVVRCTNTYQGHTSSNINQVPFVFPRMANIEMNQVAYFLNLFTYDCFKEKNGLIL